MSGHTSRRYRGLKRTHHNQDLGPFINHEMNRCIACYRCVRFYGDYAGGKDLQVFGVHNNVYFGRFEDGALENEFSGNLVEVCPTGVFTDKTFSAHYTRKWDLQTAPSVCTHCGIGCNTAPGERYGTLRRVINRYHGEVNGYFLCDRGRFGYGFVNDPERIRRARCRGQSVTSVAACNDRLRELLKDDLPAIGIASPRASLEANYALRCLVGEENFFLGLNAGEHSVLAAIAKIMRSGGIHSPSLREVEQADAVFVLGEDVTHSAPRLALALRQAARNAAFAEADSLQIAHWQDAAVRELEGRVLTPVFIAGVCATRLDDIAAKTYTGSPEAIARLGFAVASQLDNSAPSAKDLDEAEQALAARIAEALRQAERPLVVSGTGCNSLAVVHAAYNVAKALAADGKQLAFTVPECNSLGLAVMGGRPLHEAFERSKNGLAGSVLILENDLYRRAAADEVDEFFQCARHVAVLDSLENSTTTKAELVLPAATFAESEGTWVNSEGRAQRYFPVFPATAPVRASWQWLADAADTRSWRHLDELTAACAWAFPGLAAITAAAPGNGYTVEGCKIPRQPHRYSGRTAMLADIKVSEPAQPQDPETPFAFSMEGDMAQVPPAVLPVVWAPGWNSNQAIGKFQQHTGGALRGGNPGVRLFEATGSLDWFGEIPAQFLPEPERLRLVALPHIFGSEELSLHSPPILERAPSPCALLNPVDAEALSIATGDSVDISPGPDAAVVHILVRIEPTLPRGLLGITAGLPVFSAISFQSRVSVKKANGVGGGND